jgi:hypothetical protein
VKGGKLKVRKVNMDRWMDGSSSSPPKLWDLSILRQHCINKKLISRVVNLEYLVPLCQWLAFCLPTERPGGRQSFTEHKD